MAKYSTGGVGGDSGGACELCGSADVDLRTEQVAGATLEVCADCAHHGDTGGGGGSGGSGGGSDQGEEGDRDRKRRAARNAARISDARKGDPERWQEGTDYESDPLPYLVGSYGERLEAARQDAGLQPDELAGELGVDEADVLAVEQGRAARAGVGGSLIEDLEEHLNVRLADDGEE